MPFLFCLLCEGGLRGTAELQAQLTSERESVRSLQAQLAAEHEAERQRLDAEAEKLHVAKSLVDLQVEGEP